MADDKPVKKSKFDGVRAWFAKYIGGVFMETRTNGTPQMSIGRVSYFIVLCCMIWMWRHAVIDGGDVSLPPGMLEAFYALLAYVTGGKFAGALKMRWSDKGKLESVEQSKTGGS